ncbi:dimethyladenosine transferase [Jimgerdemannia flammicorona]|uniref:rRNA adenine N(6)-methyltransferase n=1 Tax=Jimgerdemannia flammicorona TaxID=994334 RepID=A0A433QDQ0_9FUNG|nr:dimethyladenosine transferase [Jimgerdemannia flammicorona]
MPKITKKQSKKGDPVASAGRAFGPMFNKDLGQHILKNPLVAQGIVDKANLRSSDTVLEVGPGTGNLTVKILAAAKKVVAVEMDPRLAAELQKRVQETNDQRRLDIMVGDFMKTDLPFRHPWSSNSSSTVQCFGWHPLALTHLTFTMNTSHPSSLFLYPHQMRRAHVSTRVCPPLDCETGRRALLPPKRQRADVGKNNFRPPPQVESSVVRIEPRNPPPPVDFKEWDGLMRIVFVRKNKTLAANFKTTSIMDMLEQNYKTFCSTNDMMLEDSFDMKAKVMGVLESTGMAESRAAKCDIDDFLK